MSTNNFVDCYLIYCQVTTLIFQVSHTLSEKFFLELIDFNVIYIDIRTMHKEKKMATLSYNLIFRIPSSSSTPLQCELFSSMIVCNSATCFKL